MKSQENKLPAQSPKGASEQLTSDAVNQHKKMAMGRPISQDSVKVKKGK